MLDPVPGYALKECIHQGARTDIYAARRERDNRAVLVKVYRSAASTEAELGARAEFERLARLRGRGIPEVLELVTEPGTSGLILDLAPGVRLSSTPGFQASCGPEQFLELAAGLSTVLERVHASHYLHLSIEPDHVLLDPASAAIHLLGFGHARELGVACKAAPQFSALPQYIAPEQTGRMGRGVDPRSDLYSLGATLYWMICGSPPFVADDPLALVHAHMALTPKPPSELRSDWPVPLSRIVMRLLQKEPEGRYQTARSLRLDLRILAKTAPVVLSCEGAS